MRGENPLKEISYSTQYDAIKSCYAELKIHSLKVTHAGRGNAARAAEADGADEAQIRRIGRWSSDKLQGNN